MVLDNTCANIPTEIWVSKRQLTGSEELPGATLRILDENGEIVREWISGNEPQRITGLHFDEVYTLVEQTAPNGYTVAESIRFKLVQRTNTDGKLLNEADISICTGKDWLVFDRWEPVEDAIVIMQDDFTKLRISKTDIATGEELPGASLKITDEDGKVVAEWLSTDEPHYIERIPVGKYTLTETSAPDGYLVAESVAFEVAATGEIQRVVMQDERIPAPPETPVPPQPAPPVPKTGDLPWLPAVLGAAAVLALLGLAVWRIRDKRHGDR